MCSSQGAIKPTKPSSCTPQNVQGVERRKEERVGAPPTTFLSLGFSSCLGPREALAGDFARMRFNELERETAPPARSFGVRTSIGIF